MSYIKIKIDENKYQVTSEEDPDYLGWCGGESTIDPPNTIYVGKEPTFPIVMYGGTYSIGWDIPTKWAVDSAGNCYADNAHGGELSYRHVEGLLYMLTDNQELNTANKIRKHLGLAIPEPEWMTAARRHGWTPPK